ncbi:MAG TPA: hypothetical protein VN376_08625 [Longilinea sp.]|nr:hypothetical protein [Longilinea sp.]
MNFPHKKTVTTRIALCGFLLLIILAGCTGGITGETLEVVGETDKTPTGPTYTPSVTSTRTVRPTVYVQPTPTFTEFTLMADEMVTSIDRSYTLLVPSSFDVIETYGYLDFHDYVLFVFSEMYSYPDDVEYLYGLSDESIAIDHLSLIGRGGGGGLNLGDPYPVMVDGVEGTGFNVSGTRYDTPEEGEIVIVKRNHIEVLVIMALSSQDRYEQQWQDYDQALFQEVLDSFHFNRETPCTVSASSAYGYSQNLPIGVGGGDFAGETLIEVYLSSLRGPDGQTITYEYIDSIPYDDSLLVRYNISYSGLSAPVELFFDINNFTNPMAPVGFSCFSDFEFGLP